MVNPPSEKEFYRSSKLKNSFMDLKGDGWFTISLILFFFAKVTAVLLN
jgi:hypothetical protein